MASNKRKPYVREMKADWWKNNPFYRFYMLREGTSLFAVWVSLLLMCGMANPNGFDDVVSNPIIILINIVALAAALLHTKTWFELAPKAMPLNEKQTELVVKGLWGITVVASVVVLLVAFAG